MLRSRSLVARWGPVYAYYAPSGGQQISRGRGSAVSVQMGHMLATDLAHALHAPMEAGG
jgi:hypothetical protein